MPPDRPTPLEVKTHYMDPHTPYTPRDIAEQCELTTNAIRERLYELEEQGEIRRRETSAGTVFWYCDH